LWIAAGREGLTLVTVDAVLEAYQIPILDARR